MLAIADKDGDSFSQAYSCQWNQIENAVLIITSNKSIEVKHWVLVEGAEASIHGISSQKLCMQIILCSHGSKCIQTPLLFDAINKEF